MKAIWFERAGDADDVLRYGEREPPLPGDGEVLVRLRASAVNPSDVKKRAGLQPAGLENGFVIPHSDGAGVIESVGGGVPPERVGERVWVYQAQYQRHLGTAAEYVAVPSGRAAWLPEPAAFTIGACAGIPMMTAHRCVFADSNADGDVAGQTILVSGASGRVGFYAAQLAKLAGARVIGTAGGAQRCRIAAQAGCDLVLNYRADDLIESVQEFTGGDGVERIIDVEFGANADTNSQILKTNGVIVSYASSRAPQPAIPFYPMMFNNTLIRLVLVYNMPESAKRRAIADLTDCLERDRLIHRLAALRPLEQTAAAHQAIERGESDGCVVLEIG